MSKKQCPIAECPFQGRPVIPYDGERDVDVMVVGESPGNEENERGRPFVGISGQVLNAVLEETGLSRSLVYVANSTRCTLDKDNDSVKDQNAALKCCRKYLEKAVKVVRPKVIIALGAVALKQLMGLQKIMENRGRFFTSGEFGCKVFCTVHPAYVLRGASREFWKKKRLARTMKENLLFEDFSQVRKFLETNKVQSLKRRSYKLGTAADLNVLSSKKVLAIDFETTGLDLENPKTRALSVAFSYREGESFVYRTRAGKFPRQVNELLQTPEIAKIVAARPFEERVCRQLLGFEMRGRVHDVLEMAHLVDENYHRYSLESCADIYTPLKGIKSLAEGMRANLEKAPVKVLVQYNSVDTDATLRVYNRLKEIMSKDMKLTRYYAQFMQRIQTMFADIWHNGCRIDTKQLAKDEKELQAFSAQMHQECIDMIPDEIKEQKSHVGKLRLSRDSLIREFLFTHKAGLRWKPDPNYLTPKTKVPQCSEDHLNLQPDHPFTNRYIRMRKANKILSTYHRNYWKAIKPDGRVYPSTQFITVTGRTTMKEPTIQTVPQRNEFAKFAKRCFVADKGWLMGARDLGQSEIRIMGWQAKEPTILQALKDDIDIHIVTAALVNNYTVAEFMKLPKAERKRLRQQAKGVNFGFLYGMGAKGFRIYAKETYGLDLTLEECEALRDGFFRTYRRLIPYHKKIERMVIRDGFIRSRFGRVRRLPDARSQDWKKKGQAVRQAVNFPIQGFSSDLGLLGMYLFWLAVKKGENGLNQDNVKVMWFIHDNVIFQSKRGVFKKAMRLLKECQEHRAKAYMRKYFKLEIGYPITSDGKCGSSWESMKAWCDKCVKVADEECDDKGHV